MVKAVNSANCETAYCVNQPEAKKAEDKTRILPNTPKTRIKQGFQKTSSAFLDYPVKGLKGDINSNFYEFLTMGIVPYLAGSAMFMFVFNCINKHLESHGRKIAADKGYKMALGVIFYGILKSISKNLVTKPVKNATGIDTEMPYENIVYPLPKEAGEAANIEVQHQQRKVYDSKEFFRKDLLDREYFDKVAAKLGLGENLNDSITETTPIIQNVVATTNTAKSLSSYCWAGVGVALAVQDSWTSFFKACHDRTVYRAADNQKFFQRIGKRGSVFLKNCRNISLEFVKSLGKACKQLWKGPEGTTGFMKHTGKAFVGFTAVLTAFLTLNTIIRAKNMAKNKNKNTIDKTKETTVI